MSKLASNLLYLQEKHKLRQGQMAKIAGIVQSTYSRAVAPGSRTDKIACPSADAVAAWAKHFGVSIDDLMERDLSVSGPSKSQSTTPDEAILASALVSVKQAVIGANLTIDRLHELAPVIVLAYALRAEQPREMSREAYRAFDEAVRLKLHEGLDDEGRKDGRTAKGGTRGHASAQKRKAQAGRR